MGASQDDIRVRIAGDLADIQRQLRDLRRETKQAGADAKRSRADWQELGGGLDRIGSAVKGIVGAYLSFRGVSALFRSVISNTIEAERVSAQLEARVRSTGQVAGFTAEQLLQQARDLQLVTAFGDEAIASMQGVLLTFTQVRGDQFIGATEAILNMATALNTDLQSAALQVGKALNDPIRGVTALQRAGVQLNATQRELIRSLQESGDVAGAQRVILAELETQFGGAARAARNTLGGALEALKNAFGDLLEADDASIGGLRDAVEELIALVNDPAIREGFAALTSGLLGAVQAGATFVAEFGLLGKLLGEQAALIAGNVTEMDRLEAEIRNVDRALRSGFFGRPIALLGKSREELQRMRADLEAALEAARQAGGLADLATGGSSAPAVEAPTIPIDARPAIRALQSQLAAAGVLLQDELKRLGSALDAEFADNLVRFGDYYRQRAELETRAIEQQLEQQRAALRLLDEEIRLAEQRGEEIAEQETKRARLVAEITVLERQRSDVATKAARDQAIAERALVRELEQVQLRVQQLQGDTIGARGRQLELEFRDLMRRLQAEGDREGQALVERLINLELARSRLSELEDSYQRSLSALARSERRVELQVQTGLISEREGRRQIIALHQRQADELERLIPLMRELADATGDPAALERLEQMTLEIEELRASAQIFSTEIARGIRDSGASALSQFLQQTETAKGALQSFLDDMRRRIADFVAERLFDKLFESLLSAGGGAGGGGGFGSFLAGLFHEGGVVGGAGGRKRRVPALAFAGAPRLHSGLGPREFPAILERGEEVLSRRDPRNSANGGGGVNVTVMAQDVESFRRASPGQIGAGVATAILRARNRNGA